MTKIRSKDQEKPGAPGFRKLISPFDKNWKALKRSYIITDREN